MKILIASDSFKHSVSSAEAGECLKRGILRVPGEWQVLVIPVADGGEGTLEALTGALAGEIHTKEVHDPLMRKCKASFGISEDGKTGVIEMASASGIELLSEQELDPEITSTFGTGELMVELLDRGCTRIIVGMGGSATNDGGTGMLKALGARFLDGEGNELEHGGGALCRLHKIEIDRLDKRLKDTEIIAATDVRNVLLGEKGASLVYGPQKGADHHMALRLDQCLKRFAELTSELTGSDHAGEHGSGAAGGLGFGMRAYLGARIENGFNLVADYADLENYIGNSDLVITGEGKMDEQTQYGKTPMGVAELAKKKEKPVIAVAGSLGKGYQVLYELGISTIFPLPDRPMSLDMALKNAPSLLEDLGERIARMLRLDARH